MNLTDWHSPHVNNEAYVDEDVTKNIWKNKINKVGYAKFVYKLMNNFGVLGDASYNAENRNYWDYALRDEQGIPIDGNGNRAGFNWDTYQFGYPLSNVAKMYETSVTKLSGGFYFNIGNDFSLVSKVTSIKKNKIKSNDATLYNTQNTSERGDFGPVFYDIETLGWSTDIVATPFKNFNLHFLLTLQEPKYKDYKISGFSHNDGTQDVYDFSDNYIPSLSKVLMEIDPSYFFAKNKFKAWFSLRYYGKQYGENSNNYSYNPWWENFGGIDYYVNRKLSMKLQVVNFLDQKGIKGTIQGAIQTTAENVQPIVATAIRPRTVELKIDYKF